MNLKILSTFTSLVVALLYALFVTPEVLGYLFKMQEKHQGWATSQGWINLTTYYTISAIYWIYALLPVLVLGAYGLHDLFKSKRPKITSPKA